MTKKKVLIIDDEDSICDLLKKELDKTGKYEVATETKGINGIAATKEFMPDVVLLDVLMPDMLGNEIAHQFQKHEDIKDIPIIFVTAIAKKNAKMEESISSLGYYVLPKPVSAQRIMKKIEECLKDKKS